MHFYFEQRHFFRGSVYHNRLPSNWVAYTTEIYFLLVLQAENLRSGGQYGWVLARAVFLVFRRSPAFCVFTWHECVLSRFSRARLFATLWTVAHQAPLSMGFSRQGYWSGLPFPSPGDLPDPGIESTSPATPALQVDSLLLSHWMSPFIWQRETKQALVIILMRVLIPSWGPILLTF